jgi:hypothetical protein
MSHAQAKQELAGARNTIAQLGKNQSPFKRQRREGWSNRPIRSQTWDRLALA